jgi:hypothetical protein
MAEQKRQELRTRQEGELQSALSPVESEEQEAINQLKQQLQSDMTAGKEEAEATLSDEALQAMLQELQEKYDSELADGTAGIKDLFSEKRGQATSELTSRHEQEMTDLNAQLDAELEQKIAEFEAEEQKLAQEQAEQEHLARQRVQQERLERERAEQERIAREQAATAQPVEPVAEAAPAPYPTPTPVGPGPGTRAPVQPVVIPQPPPVTEKGLRREGDAPLGQRRFYVNKYFRSGEALQKINPSEDLVYRERHEMVITFWMEGSETKGVPRFMVNGVPVQSWQDLEKELEGFRAGLIAEKHILYPKVILDQRRDVPRSVVDDILSVCFKVGIRYISMGSREPQMEQ